MVFCYFKINVFPLKKTTLQDIKHTRWLLHKNTLEMNQPRSYMPGTAGQLTILKSCPVKSTNLTITTSEL